MTSGESNAAKDAGACADQCKAARGCNAWMWCNDEDGCRSEGDVALPRGGCHLETQQPAFPVEPPMSWPISTFVAGWQGGKPLRSLAHLKCSALTSLYSQTLSPSTLSPSCTVSRQLPLAGKAVNYSCSLRDQV